MSDDLNSCYAALDVSPRATAASIRQAYLDLVKVWHPDRFQDESPRFRLKVEAKIKEINSAYEMLRSGAPAFQTKPRAAATRASSAPSAHLSPMDFGERWGYVDENGRVVISPRFRQAEPFSEGLALVLEERRYGFIDESGEYAVYPEFASARSFAEGLAAVSLNVRWGFVDSSGRFCVNPEFEDCGEFSEGLAAVRWRGSWGFIDDAGRFVIRPQFAAARAFREDWAEVLLGRRWGRVNRAGHAFVETAAGWIEAGSFNTDAERTTA